MMIPLVDLKAQYLTIKEDVDRAIQKVVDTTAFTLGEDVGLFEQEFARYVGTRHAVGVSSGTAALHLALLACGVAPGDEVITVAHTFIATAEAVSYCGARPVFVDIDPATYNMDVTQLEEKISAKTKAILPVHLYGQPVDMDPLVNVARKHGLKIVEDAAQAHGAEYKGRKVGTMGDVACFSFYPGKNLGAYGDGGAITTDDDRIAQKIRTLRDHGRVSKYEHATIGYGDRLDTIQAAVLRVKLRKLDEWNGARRRHAARYSALLAGAGVHVPVDATFARSVYHLYVIRVDARERMQQALAAAGIATGIHYPLPLHLQPAYRHLEYRVGDLPITEQAASEILSLPMYAELTDEQVEHIAAKVRECRQA